MNTNGLIRRYVPKRSDITAVTDQNLKHIMNRLNHRPRKCLNFQTPAQVFSKNSKCCTSNVNTQHFK